MPEWCQQPSVDHHFHHKNDKHIDSPPDFSGSFWHALVSFIRGMLISITYVCLFSCVAAQPHRRTVAEPEFSPTAKLRGRKACGDAENLFQWTIPSVTLQHYVSLFSLVKKIIAWLSCVPEQMQSWVKNRVKHQKKYMHKVGGFSFSQQWLYNMELLECVQKRDTPTHHHQFRQQLRHPPSNTHAVPWDQLCVTQQHNQSVVIAFIDSPQNCHLLFDDLMLPFLLLLHSFLHLCT